MRFMITDNLIHPKTYEITKLMDTFPLGTIKVTLIQSHYNEHTDLCGKVQLEELGDEEEVMHMICDYYKSSITPTVTKDDEDITWKLDSIGNKIRVDEEVNIKATINSSSSTTCVWTIFVDNDKFTIPDTSLSPYIEVNSISNTNSNVNILSIKIINDVLIGYKIKVYVNYNSVYETYDDFVEMEVIDG